jgi:hypothetical protein
MNARAGVLLSLLLAACTPAHWPSNWGAGEWRPPDVANAPEGSLALFEWVTVPGAIAAIDGASMARGDGGFNRARLAAGRHRIEFAAYPAEFGQHPRGAVDVELFASHAYEFRMAFCYWCKPRDYAVWVEDTTTRELVWGKRPHWPAWYL